MLAITLNTNEIKDRAAVEVEFGRIATDMRSAEYAQLTEAPSAPHRLKISHQESGSGASKRRRSLVRFDKTVTGVSTKPVVVSAYAVVDIPVGDLSTYDAAKDVLAELMSLCATTGAGTTVLFDCSGNGASALVQGTL